MSLSKKDLFSIFSKLVSEIPLESLGKKLTKKIPYNHQYYKVSYFILSLIRNNLNYQILEETCKLRGYCNLCNNRIKFDNVIDSLIKIENSSFQYGFHRKCLWSCEDFCKGQIYEIGKKEFDKKFLIILPFFKCNILLQEILNVISVMYFMFI
jgi:hypothetical protein